jgi:hypothetical protein
MELTPEVLATGAVGLVVVIGAIGQYLKSLKTTPAQSSVLQGVGIELGNREQTERLIGVQTRIAVALEALADKRTSEMEDIHRELLDRLDRREEQEEAQRRPDPQRSPRRR